MKSKAVGVKLETNLRIDDGTVCVRERHREKEIEKAVAVGYPLRKLSTFSFFFILRSKFHGKRFSRFIRTVLLLLDIMTAIV